MINNTWIFGNNCGLDFSTPIPTAISGNSINTNEGCASISDGSGNLLFYTDGGNIWDSSHTVRASGLDGDSSSTQSAIIVPDPSNSNQYYVLTMDGSTNSAPPFNHFNGVLINVNSWFVDPLSNLLTLPNVTGFSPAEKLTAIQHENCKDFWVLTILQEGQDGVNQGTGIGQGEGTIRIFKIDSSGITHHSDTSMNQEIHDLGYLKASSNSQNIAIANGSLKNVLVYPFNNSTGMVDISGLRIIHVKRDVYGVEFSPNNSLLYCSTLSPSNGTGTGYVYQADLSPGPISPIVVGTIANNAGGYAIGALQLGIDNRIYIAKDDENSLGAIESPDILGSGCNVNNNFISLQQNSRSELGLPNLLPNACEDDCECTDCTGCNKDAEEQNEELIERAKEKYNTIQSNEHCDMPFTEDCAVSLIEQGRDLTPCFSFHWGDGHNDQIEEHDTEVFYITTCNNYNDITYNGLRITKITLSPDIHPLEKIHIVPDRFVNLDCLKPCTCQTREFAMISRANDTAGNYTLEVEYCYEGIEITPGHGGGKVTFPLEITED